MATIDTIANEVYQRHLLKGVQVAPAEKEVNQESLMKRPQVEQEPEQDAATAKNVVLNFIDALSNDVYDSNIIDTAVRESSTDVQMGSDKMYGMYKTPVHIFQAMNRDVDPDTAEMYVRETPQLDYLNRLDIDTRESERELQEYRRMVAGDTEFAFPTAARQTSSRVKIPKLEVSEEPDVNIKDAPDADIVLDEPTPTRTEGLGSRPVAEAQTDDDMGLPESRSDTEENLSFTNFFVDKIGGLEGEEDHRDPLGINTLGFGILPETARSLGFNPDDDKYQDRRVLAKAVYSKLYENAKEQYSEVFEGLNEDQRFGVLSLYINMGSLPEGVVNALSQDTPDYDAAKQSLASVVLASPRDKNENRMKDKDGRVIYTSNKGLSKRRAQEYNDLMKGQEGFNEVSTVSVEGTKKEPIFVWLDSDGEEVHRYKPSISDPNKVYSGLDSSNSMRSVSLG